MFPRTPHEERHSYFSSARIEKLLLHNYIALLKECPGFLFAVYKHVAPLE